MFEAIWGPYWYDLDQPLRVGQAADFWFFVTPPEELRPVDKPVLFHGLPSGRPFRIQHCTVARIRHAELGELTAVELEPFDYTFVLESGIRIEVNAEEEPGKPYDDNIRVTDWSLVVTMEPHGDWEQLSWEEFASRLRPRPRMRPAMDPVPAKMCMPTGATSWTWRLP